MPFEFNSKAELKSLNVRKGTGDDSQVTLDIKLKVEGLPLTTAAAALGVEDPEQLKRSLFRSVSEDADENARFLGLKSLASNGSWEDKHAITFKGFRRQRVHKVRGIELVPRFRGQFDGYVTVTIQEPPSGFVELIAEQLNSVVQVHLEHDAELNLQGGDGANAAAPKAKKSASQQALKLSRHDKKLGRKDAGRALRGNSRPPRKRRPAAA